MGKPANLDAWLRKYCEKRIDGERAAPLVRETPENVSGSGQQSPHSDILVERVQLLCAMHAYGRVEKPEGSELGEDLLKAAEEYSGETVF